MSVISKIFTTFDQANDDDYDDDGIDELQQSMELVD